MTMRVTIITTLMGESGSLLTAGNTYTVSDSFGAYLVGGKRATDTDGVLKNLLQKSDVIRVTAPYTLAAGDGCLVGAIFGISTGPVTSGNEFDMMTTGVFVLSAGSSVVASAGAKAYWDNTARNITTDAAGVLVGVFAIGKTNGQLVATVAIGVHVANGGGGGTWGSIAGTLGDQTDLAAALATKATAYAPVALTGNTTLTRGAHYNRQIIVTTAGAVTLTATGTDALAGDFISIDVVGGGSVTLAGVTAQSGYSLTAISGGTVEAKSIADASLVAATKTVATATGDLTFSLVDGSFTSNNLNLTSSHTNCVLDLSAVTIPVTLTWQTDASGGYDTTSCKLRVLAGPVAPVAIIAGSGATLIGGVQVIEQAGWGGGHRTAANTLALSPSRRGNQSLASALSQFGMSVPASFGSASVNTVGMASPNAIDSSVAGTGAATSDGGTIEFGALKRVRYTATVGANHAAGVQHILSMVTNAANSYFPMAFSSAIADAISGGNFVMGLCSNPSAGLVTADISSASTLDLIALAADGADTNMQIMTRSGASSVAATKIDLGASFPKSQYVAYQLTLYKNNAGTAFIAVVQNMNTKAFTVKVLTSNLPRMTQAYYSIFNRASQLLTTPAAALDYIGLTVGAS